MQTIKNQLFIIYFSKYELIIMNLADLPLSL
jgi:hypothetical protein